MSDNTTQPGVRLNESVWRDFRQDVQERKGAVNGYLSNEVERALKEYMNASEGGDTHDRLVAIEQELSELRAAVEEDAETKKDSGLSTTTEKRLQKITETIREESDGSPKVHNQVVELAIRKHAGGSDPTIQRYTDLLMQDRELFPHPANSSHYFRTAPDFAKAVNQLTKAGQVDQATYDELVGEYGEDWWKAQLDDGEQSNRKGFE